MTHLFKLVLKKLIKITIFLIVTLMVIKFSFLQNSASIYTQKKITPNEIKVAKGSIKKIADKLASTRQHITFEINQTELGALSKLGSHLLPRTLLNINASNFGILISTSTELSASLKQYMNVDCWLFDEYQQGMKIDKCTVGNITINGWFVETFFIKFIRIIMGEEVANTANELINKSVYKDNAIVFSAQKSKDLKQHVNDSMSAIGDLASFYAQSNNVSAAVVNNYLTAMDEVKSTELSDYITVLFNLAKQRSIDNDPAEENSAIIWALAVKFGSARFAKLIGVKRSETKGKTPLLRGRADLTLHFIYSAVIQQLSDFDIGLNIGEAKELLDANSGGSGYSFSDLAADKAGLQFAQYITSGTSEAENAQNALMNISNENEFFPFIHDLPGGFTGNHFKRVIQSTESDTYKKIETEIDQRIEKLGLYNKINKKLHKKSYKQKNHNVWDNPNKNTDLKRWITVDTHMHTNYSDGAHSVQELAENANKYGCDAIAITDHGNYNLTTLFNDTYFQEIERAGAAFPALTVIPGLEWNIPPMSGREHVTVLLPKSEHLSRNLTAFRDRYDHYKQLDKKYLSPQEAFEWLNKHGVEGNNKAVAIYNHPSRKDYQTMENEHDIAYWQNFSNLVVGFSGSPGHQKKRGNDNGSYNQKLHTVNGWDPAIEKIGGEWDTLLQQGYKVWGARAASDFHNTKMDYWPCQFSTTHLYAKSNQHNDVLSAFHSGAYWAQHGKFIKKVDFSVDIDGNQLIAGQSISTHKKKANINLSLTLNQKDWQGYPTSLDKLELVIITDEKIITVPFYDLVVADNQVTLSYEYNLSSPSTIFRWRGLSIQPGQHHYMFYSNPIKVGYSQ